MKYKSPLVWISALTASRLLPDLVPSGNFCVSQTLSKMKTQLEKAMECVVNIFHQYCILDPIDDYLQEKEFEKLMKEQAQPFLKNTLPPNVDINAYIRQLFQKADKNKDGKLKFTEFLIVMGATLNEAHERSHDLNKERHGHGHGHGHDHGHGHGHDHGHGHGHGPVSSGN